MRDPQFLHMTCSPGLSTTGCAHCPEEKFKQIVGGGGREQLATKPMHCIEVHEQEIGAGIRTSAQIFHGNRKKLTLLHSMQLPTISFAVRFERRKEKNFPLINVCHVDCSGVVLPRGFQLCCQGQSQ